MSLVGNLEDLSLGDILQIISLSQKSGVLALASDHGSGRVVFERGVVTAACLKGGPNDLRELLLRGGFIDPAGYDAALARAQAGGVPVEETLAKDAELSPERIEGVIREAAESAILEMFSWPAGDFSFDVRAEPEPEDPHLILPTGINAQYLAMEGLRLRDERERDGTDVGEAAGAATGQPIHDPLFGDDLLETDDALSLEEGLPDGVALLEDAPAETAQQAATEALVATVVERFDERPGADSADSNTDLDADLEGAAEVAAVAASRQPVASRASSEPESGATLAPLPSAKTLPVVLIDPDVTVLEWAKAAIEADFARVHVFQQADQGLARIRQYLIRGDAPLVIVSSETRIDPLSGIRGLGDFVKRLKAQAPRLIVVGLRDGEDPSPAAMPDVLDRVLKRPARRLLADRRQPDAVGAGTALARQLLEILTPAASGTSAPGAGADDVRTADVSAEAGGPDAAGPDPEVAIQQLTEASSRGEILPVVLDFAALTFARVAILVIRENAVFAVAGRGIPTLEVDPLASVPSVSFPMPTSGWLRRVLDSGSIQTGPPEGEADLNLLACFGGDSTEEAFVAPIESDSSVIALLYADQGPSARPLPDTRALEEVLQHAGLALDRAALERAFWEVDGDAR